MGAGLGASTAAGLGTAGGLGLAGAAATPALSVAAPAAGTALGAGTLGAGTAIGSSFAPAVTGIVPSALGYTGGISTAGGIAPQLMAQGPSWLDSLWGGVKGLGGKAGGILNSDMGKMVLENAAKKDDGQGQPAPALGGMAPRSGTGDGGGGQAMTAEDQMNALLSRLFAAQGA